MDELQSLLDYLVENEEYIKACILSLAMNNGRRKAEIPRFKVNYFDDKNLICEGALYKTPEKMVTKGRGIQGKLLDVYTLAKPFKPYFDLWMEERKRLKIRSEWLFPRREGGKWMDKPMKTETLDSWAQTFSALMKKPFYWHSLRHFFTTRLAEANLPDSVIQDIIGWLDLPDKIAEYTQKIISNIFDLLWSCGIQTVLFIAGLQSIPRTLYEASKVEGASKWEEFWFITFPSLGSVTLLVAVFTMVDQFTNSRNQVVYQAYQMINSANYDETSAMLWIYFVCAGAIMGIILFAYNRFLLKRWS